MELVHAARNGDRQAFGRLVDLYQRSVYSLAYRMLGNATDAEDAAQEAFLRAFRSLGGYDASRAFSTWILSIAAHYCIDRIRRRRMTEVSLDAVAPLRWNPPAQADPEARVDRAADAERVRAGLAALPEDYRAVVILRYWHDMGYGEIAAILGESESAIKSRLHRARRRLAEFLPAGEGQADSRAEGSRAEPADGARRAPEGRSPCSATAPAN
jgi:RNA polymerase sigma-70 factor (ECF subfamily)